MVDIDGTSGAGSTAPFAVTPGEDISDVDAGVSEFRGSISGRYFCDVDGDGIDDGDDNDEFGIFGTVTLLLADGMTVATDDAGMPITTDTDFETGEYTFENLIAGNYIVQFSQPENGKIFIAPNVGDDDTVDSDVIDPVTGTTGLVEVLPATETADVDAGARFNTGTVTGRYFIDSNNDARDDNEAAGVANAEVLLIDSIGMTAGSTSTETNGNYSFTGVLEGDYTVVFAADPAGRTFVAANQGDDLNDSDVISIDGGSGAGTTETISVLPDQVLENVDAGVSEFRGSISGRYFCDADGDGIDDGDDNDEFGIFGTVTLLLADGTTVATDDAGMPITTDTDFETGEYKFENLIAGNYIVQFSQPENGKIFIAPNVGNDDTVDSDVIDPITGTTGLVEVLPATETADVDAGATSGTQNVSVSGEIITSRTASQTVTFIIDHSESTFTMDAIVPSGFPGEDLNDDGMESIFDGMLRSIVERAKEFSDDTQEFHIILSGATGVVAEQTYTVGDIKTNDTNGTLDQLFGVDLNPGGTLTDLNLSAGLAAAEAFITGMGANPNGAAQDEIVILTTGDALFQEETVGDNGEIILGEIMEVGGTSTGPGTAFASLTDTNGIDARINAVVIESGFTRISDAALDAVDEDGMADVVNPGDDLGLGTLITFAAAASVGTVVRFEVELDGNVVGSISVADLTPSTQVSVAETVESLILSPTAVDAPIGAVIDIVLGIDNVGNDGVEDQELRLSTLQPGLDRTLDDGETAFDFLVDLA